MSDKLTQRYEGLQKLSVALMSEKDLGLLLSQIVDHALTLLQCDAASLFVKHSDDYLSFEVSKNCSVETGFQKSLIPLHVPSIVSYCFSNQKILNIPDVYDLAANSPYHFNRSFDQRVGYRTKSMLAIPLCNQKGQALGVLQLINKKDSPLSKWPTWNPAEWLNMPDFNKEDESLMLSFSSIAAAAIENSRLYDDIQKLMEGFVVASVEAIESRDTVTRGHSERVARICVSMAETFNRSPFSKEVNTSFTKEQIHELRYAALLHDFGKIGVKESVLLKQEKLSDDQKTTIRTRLNDFIAASEIKVLRHILFQLHTEKRHPTEKDFKFLDDCLRQAKEHFEDIWSFVLEASKPSVQKKNVSADKLKELSGFFCFSCGGDHKPVLESDEIAALSIPQGTLSFEERQEIEMHVEYTRRFLSKIPWTSDLRLVTEYAYSHHEKLDGSGYPRKLKEDSIPYQVRILTLCDTFDALVARDRPYKPAVPLEKALDIIKQESLQGRLDKAVFELFLESRPWEDEHFQSMLTGPIKKVG